MSLDDHADTETGRVGDLLQLDSNVADLSSERTRQEAVRQTGGMGACATVGRLTRERLLCQDPQGPQEETHLILLV